MNDEVKIKELKKGILSENERNSTVLRNELIKNKTVLINVMSSPGSGKTTTLVKTINLIKDRVKVCVMEADIDSDVDAHTIKNECGVEAVQLHTGGMCHLDAEMTREGLYTLETKNPDLVFLENVGNLVCPAEYDTGSYKNITILSVPEGMDKPLKYPLMYSVCDLVLINKIDVMKVFDFDIETVTKYIHKQNPKALIIPISAKTGEGIPLFADWLLKNIEEIR